MKLAKKGRGAMRVLFHYGQAIDIFLKISNMIILMHSIMLHYKDDRYWYLG